MEKHNKLFTIIAGYAAILYCIIVTLIFSNTSLSLAVALALILAAPVVFALFYGIGRIIALLESIDSKLIVEEIPELDEIDFDIKDEEIYEDVDADQVNIDEIISKDDEEKVEEEENVTESTEEETPSTPEIINGKIKCNHCGKLNKAKRNYCFLCGKKLK